MLKKEEKMLKKEEKMLKKEEKMHLKVNLSPKVKDVF